MAQYFMNGVIATGRKWPALREMRGFALLPCRPGIAAMHNPLLHGGANMPI
jgi:hypothetical protein